MVTGDVIRENPGKGCPGNFHTILFQNNKLFKSNVWHDQNVNLLASATLSLRGYLYWLKKKFFTHLKCSNPYDNKHVENQDVRVISLGIKSF